jgi:Holliday junction resolvase RusA-like endonuclease
MIELELPYPPSVNHYYRRVGNRILISREGRAYRWKVGLILTVSRTKSLDGNLEIWIEAYPPDRRRRDCDNLLKSVLDSLEYGGLYHNDSQVKRLHIEMMDAVKGGRLIVRVEKINDNLKVK